MYAMSMSSQTVAPNLLQKERLRGSTASWYGVSTLTREGVSCRRCRFDVIACMQSLHQDCVGMGTADFFQS